MLRICICLPGTIDNGYYSPERGESRWSQNLMCVLSFMENFDIVAMSVSQPAWGESKPLNSVRLCTLMEAKYESKRNPFDILFDPSWFHPGMTEFYSDFKAKVFIHGHWGGCCYEEPGRFGFNHFIAFPNAQVASSMVACAFRHLHKHIFIPIPLIFSLGMEISEADKMKKGVIWGAKEVFYKRKEKKLRERALKLWTVCDIMKREGLIEGMEVLSGEELIDKNNRENDAECISYIEKTEIYKRSIFHPVRLSYLKVQNLLGRHKVLIRTGEPPGAPMEYEGIATGCLPLIWKSSNHPFQRYYDFFGLTLDDDMGVKEIRERIEVLMLDEKVREQLYYLCLKEISVHFDYQFIASQLVSVLEEFNKKKE